MEIHDVVMSRMGLIRRGIMEPKGSDCEDRFADAVYGLFREFSDSYQTEWDRITDNEEIYQGNHWNGISPALGDKDPHAPKPTTPIITSTIENIKADLSDEFPEAIISPDSTENEMAARVLTQVVRQELENCGFSREYDKLTQDVLNDGWSVWEVGYDPDANRGNGGSYLRYVVNKNFMCDPECLDMQEGRAVFKFDRRPYDWFAQHYPDKIGEMHGDDDLVGSDHDDFGATTRENIHHSYRLLEAWFRVYDPETRKHAVHMLLLAGHKILENSYWEKPEGYFKHGLYPFVITRLYPQKGSALGLGITDLFKDAQRFSDKLDQILLMNTFRASRPRLLIQKDMVDYDDARDFSKEVLEVEGNPQAATSWMQANPLPSHIMSYISIIREGIKQESGSNDQSRGQTTSGVTAASAITALQEMSTKRSRMEARALHYGFEEAVRMLLDVLSEFTCVERNIDMTVVGKKITLPFSKKSFRIMFPDGTETPIGFRVSVKTARQTKYSKMQHNELWLQMMNALGGTVDPAIMIEGLEYDEKERLLDNIRAAQSGGMLNLQKQLAEMTQMVEQQQQQIAEYKKMAQAAQQVVAESQQQRAMAQQTAMAPQQGGANAEMMPQGPRVNASNMASRMG